MNNSTNIEALDNILNVSGSCFIDVNVFANGMWNEKSPMLSRHLIRFHVQLIVIVSITNVLHFFFKRIYLPRFTSEILTGILLGPTLFEKEFRNESRLLFPPTPDIVISSLVKFGYTLFVFTAGVRMDPSLVSRIGRKAWILGVAIFLVQDAMLLIGYAGPNAGSGFKTEAKNFFLIYFNAIISSQFVGVSNILMQLKITNSRLGHLALTSTMISELLRVVLAILLSCTSTFRMTSTRSGLQKVIFTIILVLVVLYPLRYLSLWLIRNTSEDKPIKEIYTTLVVALVLTLASMGGTLGLKYVYGPFILGLLVPSGSLLATNILKRIEAMVLGLLIPLLSTFCAMKFDLWLFFKGLPNGDSTFLVTLSGFILKLIGTYIAAITCKLSSKDAAAFTLIVNAKGAMEVGDIMSYSHIQNRDMVATSEIFLVFLLATVITPLVRIFYDSTKQYIGHKKKSIEQTPDDAVLQIVACAYKQEDAVAAVKLLDWSNPTKQSPITLYGLCLEELIGSDTPVWIDHELGQKINANRMFHSQPLIDVFMYFKSQHKKLIQVHIFTAISPLKQMHEDICRLSFERAASLVIVPFHKKWNNKGKLVSTNMDIRALNINVLERAPCSVGIFIDRGLNPLFSTSSTYRICVVFIGGPDDREALAYALRMAGSDRVQLTVMHFTVPEDLRQNSWEAILDNESLRAMRGTMTKKNMDIEYIEESVNDGYMTESVLTKMKDQFDLFLIGRNQDSNPQAIFGLSNWMELAELGPIGDLLASVEFSSPASVLVVQQQIMKADHSSTLN